MKIFDPYQLKNILLKNRIVMAPMTRGRADNEKSLAVDIMATYYQQRASAGLIITEGVFINEMAVGYMNIPKIQTEEQKDSWRPIAHAVHEKNGKIFMQIWHVGASSHPTLLNGALPLSPSGINPNIKVFAEGGFIDTVTPKAMDLSEIKSTIKDFGIAAKNAIDAGMDGIEIHAANGYLFNQFFQKSSNKRTDEYGGSIENRTRFLFETLDEIKKHISIEQVGIRFSPKIDDLGVKYDDETEALYKYILQEIQTRYNVAYLHFNGLKNTKVQTSITDIMDIAKCMRQDFNGTIIINTGLTKEIAEEILDKNYADLFAFGVPFIANPTLVEKLKNNEPLAPPLHEFFYTGGAEGYITYQ
jgi:N-ethylmaleimide reductase